MSYDFVVGKYTLESLTNGMYASPMDLYREYIQNAVDSLDEAIRVGLNKKNTSEIEVSVNTETSTIHIKDNGCGINKTDAERLLVDIGNSQKSRCTSRGFRGIGRLAGLGYCDSLSFTTSAKGEATKTVITFDAKKLKHMLSSGNNDESIYDVIEAVVSKKVSQEKSDLHYFEVVLNGVSKDSKLLDYSKLKEYMVQNLPLPFDPTFKWGPTILSKLEIAGYEVPEYNVVLDFDTKTETLYKPYKDIVVSDRVKKLNDTIKDVRIKVLGDPSDPLAIMWYATTNYYGTIVDNSIKGLRIRQGNILIGDNTTCSKFFKEERFNGWVLGEVHIVNQGLIANSRRDNFEQNEFFFSLNNTISECASELTKEIRKLSSERNLSNEKKIIVQAETLDDVNALCVEDMDFACETDEFALMNMSDSEMEAEKFFLDKLSLVLGKKQKKTKYMALNINDKLTVEQSKVLERVFDVICQIYDEDMAKAFIETIAEKF